MFCFLILASTRQATIGYVMDVASRQATAFAFAIVFAHQNKFKIVKIKKLTDISLNKIFLY